MILPHLLSFLNEQAKKKLKIKLSHEITLQTT